MAQTVWVKLINTTANRGTEMFEHEAWVGENFGKGLNGHRVMIVGWSHWGNEEEDIGTNGCIQKVIDEEWRIPFFTQIRGYFDHQDHALFWPQVMFINFLPSLVGGAEQRFGQGTLEQRQTGQERFLRLIDEKLPHKVLVFTSRRWAFPHFDDSENLSPNFPMFLKSKYKIGSHEAAIFFLRHPQGARKEIMQAAVQYIIGMPMVLND
ncbi:MAG TPA: hypothetical protein PK677_14265 [Acidiphilium sp.]|nr:hypothetical protein [Acidiphilium sp.]HQU25361.1 hypothetical protein [Acidiphilium sp.]